MNKITQKHISKNKKGGEKILSVYWFVILFIVAAAIVYMTASFYGKPYDVRQVEADLLTNKIADCISEAGYLKDEALEPQFKDDFPGNCGITFDVEDSYGPKEQEQYYIKLTLTDFSSKNNVFEAKEGNVNLVYSCNLKGNNLPFCLKRSFYVIDKDNNQYQADIFSIVRKSEKNVK